MKFGFSWSVKDIRPDARDTACEAARRAGLPVNEWLNAVILQQATGQNASSLRAATRAAPLIATHKITRRIIRKCICGSTISRAAWIR